MLLNFEKKDLGIKLGERIMKLNKSKAVLVEDINRPEFEDDAAIEEAAELDERKIELDIPDDFDIEDASRGDLARMIKAALAADVQAANPENKNTAAVDAAVSTPDAKQAIAQNAAETAQAAELIVDPYGTAATSKIEKVLQKALKSTLRKRASNIDEPSNVLLYGSAGAGKTAMVRSWCKAHNINMFDCKASSLDIATVGGIPYPTKDKNGRYTQKPIASSYWDDLFKPNTVLFLDEFNRANSNVRGTLLSLINERELPMSTEGADGKVKNKHKFDNILFTVVAINPAGAVFDDVESLDLAEISRFSIKSKVELDPKELLIHINRVYDEVLSNPLILDTDRAIWEGQKNLANTLLSDKTFLFDSPQDEEKIVQYNRDNGEVIGPLNYRSFFQTLLDSDGTKADYLAGLSTALFTDTRTNMIKNILANYTDKPLKGNSVFSKAVNQAAAQVTNAQRQKNSTMAQSILDQFGADITDL